MSINVILERLKPYLQENVANKINLQKPLDGKNNEYKVVHPSVHIGWIPPKLPETYEPLVQINDIPCLIVGIDEGNEGYNGDSEIKIRISFVVYNPGTTMPNGNLNSSFEGYKDLLNLIDRTRLELSKEEIIGDVTLIQKPFHWGMYQDQPYPFWYGYLTFNVTCQENNYIGDL